MSPRKSTLTDALDATDRLRHYWGNVVALGLRMRGLYRERVQENAAVFRTASQKRVR
jgi:hypothetical protein